MLRRFRCVQIFLKQNLVGSDFLNKYVCVESFKNPVDE